jgi:hypothetical protein
LLLLWALPARADDVARARELFLECQQLLDAGKACDAVKVCQKGLEIKALEPLEKLEAQARSACRKSPSKSRDRDKDGIPNDDDRCPRQAEDIDGFEDDDGCPDPDNDQDGFLDEDDQCPNEAEDPDGFEDEDGCPDPDNDGDGVLDENDRCPDSLEDPDGFEDEDGCIDADNDGDGILDGDDQCPNEPENFNGRADEDGCPDDSDGDGFPDEQDACPDAPEDGQGEADGCPEGWTRSTWGWLLTGSGTGVLIVGASLTAVALLDRSEVADWGSSSGVAPVTQREAAEQVSAANTLAIVGVSALGVGAALVGTGVVLLLLGDETASELAPSMSLLESGGFSFTLGGRF